jgi:hypothetical protein
MTSFSRLFPAIEAPPFGRVYANQRWKTFSYPHYLTGVVSKETQMRLKFEGGGRGLAKRGRALCRVHPERRAALAEGRQSRAAPGVQELGMG